MFLSGFRVFVVFLHFRRNFVFLSCFLVFSCFSSCFRCLVVFSCFRRVFVFSESFRSFRRVFDILSIFEFSPFLCFRHVFVVFLCFRRVFVFFRVLAFSSNFRVFVVF